MKPERWQQLDELFHAALERTPEMRGAFLDEACAGDQLLRKELAALLAAIKEAGSFIEKPAIEIEARSMAVEEGHVAAESLEGRTIDHYRLIALLGSGGMGDVYLAQDTVLSRRVALKILPEYFTRDWDRLRRFQQEARAASALNHPNIITIYEIGNFEGRHFIATEFIDGTTLRQHFFDAEKQASTKPLDLCEVLDIAIQTADALTAAHEAHIVHRDIKTDNIMRRRRDGYVKVLDFGLAKLTEGEANAVETEAPTRTHVKTSSGVIMGTVSYMSPEQARGDKVDARTDIWSLGIVIYEIVAGCTPFARATENQVLASILDNREAPPLARFSRDAPRELERIVSRSLSKNLDERYQTAKDLLIDLRQLKKHLEFAAELERTSTASKSGRTETRIIKKETLNSIAVLPFANMSADAENEYFCHGLAEELLTALAKIEKLKVAARTSSFSFQGKAASISEIASALGVTTVLQGSVRKVRDRVRITAQLINASDGYHLWSERYDREMQDIFDVQDEITLAVIDALKVKLFGEKKAAVLKRYIDNPEAYELYLKGRYHFHKHTSEGWLKAIDLFEEAIEREPEYAPAYAGLSSVLTFCWLFSVLTTNETVIRWKAATVRALEIDDNLDEAHSALGQFQFYYGRNWEEAEREYLKAIEINPNNSEVHHQYALFLTCMERFDEATNEGLRALHLDPFSVLVNLQVGWIHLHAGRFDEVIRQDQKILEIEPNFHGAYWQMGIAYVAKGMYEAALAAYQKSLALGRYSHVLSSIGAVSADLGRRGEALDVVNQLLEMRKLQSVTAYNIARVYSRLGQVDSAIRWLEKAFQERNGEIVFLSVETKTGTGNIFGNSIRSDPRFADLIGRIGLKP